jgi:hypothetical protein
MSKYRDIREVDALARRHRTFGRGEWRDAFLSAGVDPAPTTGPDARAAIAAVGSTRVRALTDVELHDGDRSAGACPSAVQDVYGQLVWTPAVSITAYQGVIDAARFNAFTLPPGATRVDDGGTDVITIPPGGIVDIEASLIAGVADPGIYIEAESNTLVEYMWQYVDNTPRIAVANITSMGTLVAINGGTPESFPHPVIPGQLMQRLAVVGFTQENLQSFARDLDSHGMQSGASGAPVVPATPFNVLSVANTGPVTATVRLRAVALDIIGIP